MVFLDMAPKGGNSDKKNAPEGAFLRFGGVDVRCATVSYRIIKRHNILLIQLLIRNQLSSHASTDIIRYQHFGYVGWYAKDCKRTLCT
jgi:hypothetical protein